MAADKNITINFVPKGDKRLIQAFEGLANAQKKFNHQNKKGKKQLKGFALQQQRVNTGNKFLANSFSVIRSKMLLFNFAIGLGVTQLINFAKQAAKVEGDGQDVPAAPTKTELNAEPGQANQITYTPYLKYLCENES